MITLLHGDCRELLDTLPERSVQTIVTSPPYWGLRKYTDDPREIGNEPTPAAYVAALVDVFDRCWRVLRDDGVMWLNLGDAYAGSWGNYGGKNRGNGKQRTITNGSQIDNKAYTGLDEWKPPTANNIGIKPKNLIGLPWRVAFALQDAGWILRSEIIWHKTNPMPESVDDRPTRAHEYLFLFAKNARYYYDAVAIAEPVKQSSIDRINQPSFDEQTGGPKDYGATGVNSSRSMRKALENFKQSAESGSRNKRTVWSLASQPYAEAHFATFPEKLVEPCILAGSSAQACEHCGAAWGRIVERTFVPQGDVSAERGIKGAPGQKPMAAENGWEGVPRGTTHRSTAGWEPTCRCEGNTGSARSVVLDPFGGSGTVGRVAERYGRDAVLIELSAAYLDLQAKRTDKVQKELFV